MSTTYIDKIREIIVQKLSNYNGDEPVKLDYDSEFLQKILFDICTDVETHKQYYIFVDSLKSKGIYEKIDFSNVSLNNVCLAEEDLSKYKGIKVDPQIIWDKSLIMTKCAGVEFIGAFDDVKVVGTDFTGSRGARIDPQTVWRQDFLLTKCNNVEFVGTFNNCINMNYGTNRSRK